MIPDYSWLPLAEGVPFATADAKIDEYLSGNLDKKTLLDLLLE